MTIFIILENFCPKLLAAKLINLLPGFLSLSQSSSFNQYQITPGFRIPLAEIQSDGYRSRPPQMIEPEG